MAAGIPAMADPQIPFVHDYIIKKRIGSIRGTLGKTYECQRRGDGQSFAVKVIPKDSFVDFDAHDRRTCIQALLRELRTVQQNQRHPNVAYPIEIRHDKTAIYVVTEHYLGGSLMDRLIAKKGKYTENDAAFIMKQVLSALHYFSDTHHIVHGDLSPEKIVFAHPERNLIKIIGMGMSTIRYRLTSNQTLRANPYFLPLPRGPAYVHVSDMFSCGGILFLMLFGFPAFYVNTYRYGNCVKASIYRKIERGFQSRIRDTGIHGYGPWFPSATRVSEPGRDLIGNLLNREPRARMEANECLFHPWFVNLGTIEKKQAKIHRSVVNYIGNFQAKCLFRSRLIRLFWDHFDKMNPSHFRAIEKGLIEIDSKETRMVTCVQLTDVLDGIPGCPIGSRQMGGSFPNELRYDNLLNSVVSDYLSFVYMQIYGRLRALDVDERGTVSAEIFIGVFEKKYRLGDKALRLVLHVVEKNKERDGSIRYGMVLRRIRLQFDDAIQIIPEFAQMETLEIGSQEL